ncbi:MAG TPA: hypothetical protein VGR71_11800 [Nitrospira sp.]|nr:hypothetical protein [Nitrospira sp.]
MGEAELEIDHARGVIYVHDATTGETLLRICRLPKPIPLNVGLIDITHMTGVSYSPRIVDTPRPGRVRMTVSGIPKDLPPGTYPVTIGGVEFDERPDGTTDIIIASEFNDTT